MNKLRLIIILFTIVIFFTPCATAETIKLKSGKTVEAKVLKKTVDYIRVDLGGIFVQYYWEEIESVDGQPIEALLSEVKAFYQDVGGADLLSDPKDIYKARFTRLVRLPKQTDAMLQESDKALAQLLQFAKDYPNSVFVKDVQVVAQAYAFYNAVDRLDKKRALMAIKELEKITKLYPEASLEEITCKIILLKSPRDLIFMMPLQYVAYYWRGYMGQSFQDYQSVIDNFSFIKDKLVPKKDVERAFLQDVYEKLISAYMLLSRSDEAHAIMKEAIRKFPNTPLAQQLQQQVPSNDFWGGKRMK